MQQARDGRLRGGSAPLAALAAPAAGAAGSSASVAGSQVSSLSRSVDAGSTRNSVCACPAATCKQNRALFRACCIKRQWKPGAARVDYEGHLSVQQSANLVRFGALERGALVWVCGRLLALGSITQLPTRRVAPASNDRHFVGTSTSLCKGIIVKDCHSCRH